MPITDEMVEAAAAAYGATDGHKAGMRAALAAAYPLVVAECAAVARSRKGNPNATWDGGDWWDGACENVADAILALAQQETER